MTKARLDFQHSTSQKTDRDTGKLKPNNIGATSGKIPKAEL